MVTLREITLDVGRILGSSVDRKQIHCALRGSLRELVLLDACQRWRLASRTDLRGAIPRPVAEERRVSGLVFDKRGRHAELDKDDATVKATLEWAAELN
jgi:hypothetical protein